MIVKANKSTGFRFLAIALATGLLVWAGTSFAKKAPPRSSPSKANMSCDEKVSAASGMMADMKRVLESGFSKLKEAREKQDVQMLNSVNEALSAIKGLVRLAEASNVGLQEASAKGDSKKCEHEYVKISIAHTKVLELEGRLRSALGGAGEGAPIDGKPVIDEIKDTDLPSELPEDSLTDPLDLPPLITDRPPSTSPVFF
ncbi:MAG: hypothetical protein ACI9WU_000366 [Myxococcota bacterium]|jgi:hypothetical protein